MPPPYIILSPGARTTLFSPLPTLPRSIPSAKLPLKPSQTFATSLIQILAHHFSLPPTALHNHTLVIVEPLLDFDPSNRPSIAHAALTLLRMAHVAFVDQTLAVSLSTGVHEEDNNLLIVHVGHTCTAVAALGIVRVVPVGVEQVEKYAETELGLCFVRTGISPCPLCAAETAEKCRCGGERGDAFEFLFSDAHGAWNAPLFVLYVPCSFRASYY